MHDGLLQIHPPQHHPHNRGISEETADGDYFNGIRAKPLWTYLRGLGGGRPYELRVKYDRGTLFRWIPLWRITFKQSMFSRRLQRQRDKLVA